jgi:hypothetical protein
LEVTVNLYGDARKYLPQGKKPTFTLKVPAGMAASHVLDYLKIPADAPLAIVVNGVHQDRHCRLSDLDVLSVFGMEAFETPPS